MNLIRVAVDRPVAVIAAVLMIVLFGYVALVSIPIQLAPDIARPVISVRTAWPAAAPAEVEREIVIRQEDALRGLPGLIEMTGSAAYGNASVTLEFQVGTDLNKALLLVANRLDRITDYPEEADEPRLDMAGADDQPIAWFTIKRLPGNARPIDTYGDVVDDIVRDRLERIPGVSRALITGGTVRELKVVIDPQKLARYGLTVPAVVQALRAANVATSAGYVDEGKRRYVVRIEGELTTPEQARAVLLRSIEDPASGRVARATLGDIADVAFGQRLPAAVIRQFGEPALSANITREAGANVMSIMRGVRDAIDELNAGPLRAEGLTIIQTYDETVYIEAAIGLVQENIWLGGLLAAAVLLLFLRSPAPTLIVAVAIPISIVGAFVAMAAMGRSINVISLAGFAFAVGMVVDDAIVVLESIYRLRQRGLPAPVAAYEGTRQVLGAVIASTVTVVVVFVPVLLIQQEIGQLFRDIAVAISTAMLLSLAVSVTVIPALAGALLRQPVDDIVARRPVPVVDPAAHRFVATTLAITRSLLVRRGLAAVLVAVICGATAAFTWLTLPKLEYLPVGNRNLVVGSLLPPPGYNLETMVETAKRIEDAVSPLWQQRGAHPPADRGVPSIDHFFIIARDASMTVGARSAEPERVAELVPVLDAALRLEPGTFAVVSQPAIFGNAVGAARFIDVHISGADLEPILAVARNAALRIEQVLPRAAGHQMRPRPGLELGAPEVRLFPDRMRLADAGISARDFAQTIDAFNDGMRVAEITVGNERLNLVLTGPVSQVTDTQGIGDLPVVTGSGLIVPADSLAQIVITAGPTEIRHLERQRTVTLMVRPAARMPLEEAIAILEREVIAPLQADGLPPGVQIRLAGTADKLSQAWAAMVGQLGLSVAVVYLVLAILFESFTLPLIILLSVPLATAGGVAGLALLNVFVFQPLDMLTMLGFVILVGTVVKNAILLVHQTLNHVRQDGMAVDRAILAATEDRMRPIFMSTLTSVFGMLPLVLFPGAGSELYRGIGSVVVGGLSLSAVLTLAIVPPLLALATPLLRRHTRTPAAAGRRAAE